MPGPGTPSEGDVLIASPGQWSGNPTGYTYQWQHTSGSVAAGSPTDTSRYQIVAGDNAHAIQVKVSAAYSGHPSSSMLSPATATVGGGAGTALPSGVSLRAIDGGATYYADNGFTYAASSALTGMSWDDPGFFPIAQDYSFYGPGAGDNNPTVFKALGLNTSVRITQGTTFSFMATNGIWCIPQEGPEGTGTPGAETVGFHLEEKHTWSGSDLPVVGAVQSEGATATGRFQHPSFTDNQFLYGGLSGTPGDGSMSALMSSPISVPGDGTVHLNLPSADIYWFAGDSLGWSKEAQLYGQGGSPTADQMARGSNYGDMVDQMRDWLDTYPAPVFAPYIETVDGYVGGGRAILPKELNWAVWATIVHGARGVMYFTCGSDQSHFGFPTTVQGGQPISMYDQAIATHTLIRNIAPVINAPFALGYVSHNRGGYVFPTTRLVWENALDIMAKYYTGPMLTTTSGTFGPGFYIFVSVRGSASQTNVSATFTIAGNYAGSVPVIRKAGGAAQASGTVTVSGHQFTDTFADAYDVHIYGPIPNT